MVPQQCIASESVERKFSIINGQLDWRRQWWRDGGGEGAGEGKENQGKHLLVVVVVTHKMYRCPSPKNRNHYVQHRKKKNNTVSSTTNHGQQGVKGLGVKRRGNANEM